MIEVIAEYDLTAGDEAQIAALLRTAFPTDFGGRSYYKQRPQIRLVWRDGAILSQVALFYRAIRLGDDLIDIIGLGDVATLPEARKKGYAGALLDRAIEIGAASPAQYLALFGARRLYDRAGFARVVNPYLHVEMTGARTGAVAHATSQYLMVRPLGSARWPEGVPVDFLGALF